MFDTFSIFFAKRSSSAMPAYFKRGSKEESSEGRNRSVGVVVVVVVGGLGIWPYLVIINISSLSE